MTTKLNLAVQLYTLREECDRDFAGTVEDVAGIGYRAVETAGYGNLKTAAKTRKALHEAGLAVVVASNQPAAAKGAATLAQLRAVHERVVALLAEAGAELDGWRYCPHHPFSRYRALERFPPRTRQQSPPR